MDDSLHANVLQHSRKLSVRETQLFLCIEHMYEGLLLTTERAGVISPLLPQMEVGIVGQSIYSTVDSKLSVLV